MTSSPRPPWWIFSAIFVGSALLACSPAGANSEADAESGGDSGLSAPPLELPGAGLFACAPGEACTLVVVSQSLDDRVEIFELNPDDSSSTFRGGFSVDFDPNLNGDIGGEALDEPFDLVAHGAEFLLSVGHHPQRERGSVMQIPFAAFADTPTGSIAPASELLVDGEPPPGVQRYSPDAREAIHLLTHSSGRVLVLAFENDLFDLAENWDRAGSLTIIDPASGSSATRKLDELTATSCDGAWKIVELPQSDQVAISCDGQSAGALIIEGEAFGRTSVQDAADALSACHIPLTSDGRQVRHIAPAPGGVAVADSPRNGGQSPGYLLSYDEQCELLGSSVWPSDTSWDFRGLEQHPRLADRWALLNAGGDQSGVHIVGTDGTSCRRFAELDDLLPDAHDPLALRWLQGGDGFVLSAGPREALDQSGAPGGLWWLRLAPGQDPCDALVLERIDLLAGAPPFDLQDPNTWRRAGASLQVFEVEPEG